MADEEELVASVRSALAETGEVREVRMFGGVGFMLRGNLVAAASRRGLLLRVGKDRQPEALGRPGARPMVMNGRTMAGYIYVDPPALKGRAVRAWLPLAVAFVQTLPAKADQKSRRKKAEQK